MAKGAVASLTINDLSMDWTEDSRRVDKPCVKCGKPTKGRMKNGSGLVRAAHVSCAMGMTIDKAVKVYTAKPGK
jgi:hypothetical protein